MSDDDATWGYSDDENAIEHRSATSGVFGPVGGFVPIDEQCTCGESGLGWRNLSLYRGSPDAAIVHMICRFCEKPTTYHVV